ncbi:MAG TPA: DNA translocase FtsK 4TM domain-containing protein [Ilumatobacteraceae bacterium]|nr:DNA translocase FtsK 4TM domain-containing protein [Ilumatobacteraceae bacterium]
MSTWGASKKKPSSTAKKSTAKKGSTAPASSSTRGSAGKSSTAKGSSKAAGNVRDMTPPEGSTSRRDQATAELRDAVGGREHEFVGLGLIGLAILLGLAVYLNLAGPLGRGIETIAGWLFGLGRYAVPVVLVAVGVSFVRKGRSASPFKLVIGWAMMSLAVLGLLQVARGATEFADAADGIDEAGGWVGALVGIPLEALLATAGAAVLLVVAFAGGALLVTRISVRTFAQHTGGFLAAVGGPLGRAAKSGISNISTLSSDREADAAARSGSSADPSIAGEASSLSPGLYDFAAEGDELGGGELPAPKPRRTRKPKSDTGSQPSAAVVGDGAQVGGWVLPPMTFLDRPGEQTIDRKAVETRGQMLHESLASHGVETTLLGMTVGPTVTRYELELGPGVKVARVTSLQKDIAYAMAAVDVRILAPIPGRSAIGVEVPNHQRQLVALGDLLTSPEASRANNPLDVAIGKDIAGKAVFLDLAATPHMLIAGATGAGKSSSINCIITSLLMRTTPDDVRLILIDPKQVEMGQYARLPHLLTQPVTNPKKAANALGWAVKEMERRYDVLSELGYRDITGYNKAFAKGQIQPPLGTELEYEHMPYIVVVVDELNDLMMVAARDVEESITRIAQKARAVGIHLIVATQRPSVNVITGVIKANIPARMAFAVSSLTDSRVILDQPGAEKLVGKGDMLLLPGNSSVANRIQGSFVSEDEVRQVVAHWRAQSPEPIYSDDVESGGDGGDDADGRSGQPSLVAPRGGQGGGSPSGAAGSMASLDLDVTSDANAFSAGDDDEDTAMMRQAMELVVRSQLGSTSMLQRKLKVGFARAGRIMDLLEQRGVVGPSEGSKARAVLMTVEEFELLQQNGQV